MNIHSDQNYGMHIIPVTENDQRMFNEFK